MLSSSLDAILAYLLASNPVFLMIGALVLEVPRYTLSLLVVVFSGLTKPRKCPRRALFSISAIVPCYNDGDGLTNTVRSLAALRHEGISQIIVVNDGSTDGSREVAGRLKEQGLIDVVINHPRRQGKSAAINHAARFAAGALIVNVDSDSVVEAESILRLQAAFTDPKVSGVSGTIMVRNAGDTLITSLQALEYLVSITLGRTALDLFGAVSCLSGAFSMYRTSVFLELGGMDTGPGEDLEIGLRMRKVGHELRFEPAAILQTNAPKTFLRLARQRMRWDRDGYWIRVNLYEDNRFFSRGEGLGDTLSRIDFMLFDVIATLLFPFYVVYVISLFGPDAPQFFVGLYVFSVGLYFLNIAISLPFAPHRLGAFDALAVAVFPLYQGFFLKIVRFWAYTSEILWDASKRDDFVPVYVRRALYARKGSA